MEAARQKIVNRTPQVKPAAAMLAAVLPGRQGAAPLASNRVAAAVAATARVRGVSTEQRTLRAPWSERFGSVDVAGGNRPILRQALPGEQSYPLVHRQVERLAARTQNGQASTEPQGQSMLLDTNARSAAFETKTSPQSPEPTSSSSDDRWAERSLPSVRAESAPTLAVPPLPAQSGAPPDRVDAPANEATVPQATSRPRLENGPIATPDAGLLGNPHIPLADTAADCLERIDQASEKAHQQLNAASDARKNKIKGLFVARRQAIAGLIEGRIQAVSVTIDLYRSRVIGWFVHRTIAARNGIALFVARALTTGMAVAARLQNRVEGVVAGVVRGVNTVIERVLNMAREAPIPNIPGLDRIRAAVLRTAGRIAGTIRLALANVQGFAARVIGSVLRAIVAFAGSLGTALAAIAFRLAGVITMVAAMVVLAMEKVKRWLVGRMRWLARRAEALLNRLESLMLNRIDQIVGQVVRGINRNRMRGRVTIRQILAYCYLQDDYPEDDTSNDLLDRVDGTNSKEEFEASARAAMYRTVACTQAGNERELASFRQSTRSLIALTWWNVLQFHGRIGLIVNQAILRAQGHVAAAFGRLTTGASALIARVLAGVGALFNRVGALFDRVRAVVVDVVRAPLDALSNLARSIVGMVGSFLQRMISRLVDFFRSLVGGGSVPDPSPLTSGFSAFDMGRLVAAARMASPPAAVALVLVGGGIVIGEAAIALLWTILFWVGVVLLIVALLILLILAIRWIVGRVRTMPRVRPRPRIRRRPRRRRSRRAPLRWNPSLTYGLVVASGGLPGTLDATGPLPASAPLHGHHTWPRFVGGPVVQPLMSIRGTVHISTVHPTLNSFLLLTARGLGHTISTRTTDPRNIAFVVHLRRNIRDRSLYAVGMSGYYAALNRFAHPPIPAAAYLRGIGHSFPRI